MCAFACPRLFANLPCTYTTTRTLASPVWLHPNQPTQHTPGSQKKLVCSLCMVGMLQPTATVPMPSRQRPYGFKVLRTPYQAVARGGARCPGAGGRLRSYGLPTLLWTWSSGKEEEDFVQPRVGGLTIFPSPIPFRTEESPAREPPLGFFPIVHSVSAHLTAAFSHGVQPTGICSILRNFHQAK